MYTLKEEVLNAELHVELRSKQYFFESDNLFATEGIGRLKILLTGSQSVC